MDVGGSMDLAQKIAEEMKNLDEAIQDGLGLEVEEQEEPPAQGTGEPEGAEDSDPDSTKQAMSREEQISRAVNTLVLVTEQLRSSIDDAYQAAVALKEVLQPGEDEETPGDSDSEGEEGDDGDDKVSEES